MYPPTLRAIRKVSCGVDCGSVTSRRRGAVGVNPPKPTSASHGTSSRSTRRTMWVSGMWTSAGACHRTRAARGGTRKPSPSSAAANSPFLLEAVAAAPIAHHLLLDRWKVKAHSQAADHIEVLERNGDR